MDTKSIIENVNKRYSDLLPIILQDKLGFKDAKEVEMVDCDSKRFKLIFLEDSEMNSKKRNAFILLDKEVHNDGEFYSQFASLKQQAFKNLGLKSKTSASDKIDDFRLPEGYLMTIVLCGMTFLFCLAYRIGLNPTLTEIRDNLGDDLVFRTIYFILCSNLIVSLISFLVCYLRGNYTILCTCKWMLSAFVFGMLSLAVLVPSRRLKILS